MDGYNSSEFGSEDEETEYSLYAKLYFEPNEDVSVGLSDSHLGSIISSPLENEREVRSPNRTPACESRQKNITLLPSSPVEKVASQDRNGIDSRAEININNGKSLVVDHSVSSQPEKMIDVTKKTKARKAKSAMRRERHSSVCSIDSIPGSVALDNLYCHSLDSLNEEEEETLADKLIDKSLGDTISSSNKRSKKRKKEASSSEISEVEDSRCRNFEHISCGQNKKELKKEKVMSSIIYISSTSDISDHEKGKKSKKNVHESMDLDYTRIISKKKKKKKKRNMEEEVFDIYDSDSSDTWTLPQPQKKSQTVNGIVNNRIVNKNSNRYNSKVSVSFVNESPGVLGNKDFNPKTGSLKKPKKPKQTFTDSESELSVTEFPDRQELHKTKLAMNFSDGVTVHMGDSSFNSNVNITPRKSLTEQLLTVSKFSLDYTKRRPPSKKTSSCKHWTQDMVSFYDSDVSEDFDVEDIHSQQSNHGWEIDRTDYQVFFKGRYYNREDRCKLCRQFGHRMDSCMKVPCCHICSATNHTNVRDCPNFCCLWCGGPPHRYHDCKNSSAHCQICGIDGHSEDGCPDLWRRYHITVSGATPVCPSASPCVKKRVYCYICAKAGHYGHSCPLKQTPDVKLRYPLQSQEIYSYSEPVVNVNGGLMVNMEYLQGNKETEVSFMNSVPNVFGKNSQDRKPSKLMKLLVRCRKKLEVIKIVRERIRYFSIIRKQVKNLPAAVAVLKEGQKYLSTTGIPSPEFSERLEKSLQIAAEIVLGYLKKGEGRDILNHIHQLLFRVEKLSRNDSVPYYMLEDFAQTFGKIYNPPLGKLGEILHLAETYLQSTGTRLETVQHEKACFKDLWLNSTDKIQHMKKFYKDDVQEDSSSVIIDLTADDTGSSETPRNTGMKETDVQMKEKYLCNGNSLNGYLTSENSHEVDEVWNSVKAMRSGKTSKKNETKKTVSRKRKGFVLLTEEEVSNKISKSIKKKKLRVNGVEFNAKKGKEIKEKQPRENAVVGNKEYVMENDRGINTKKAKLLKKKKSGKKDASLVVKKKNKQTMKKGSPMRRKFKLSGKVKGIANTAMEVNGTINSSEAKWKKHKKIKKKCISI